jgi:transcriptional regulator with XRE-family HTH domain
MKKFTDFTEKEMISGFEAEARKAIAQREWLDKSFKIAVCILSRLKELNWTQAHLAQELGVSPQQVSKLVKGTENLTLETMAGLERVLGITLIQTDLGIPKKKAKPLAAQKAHQEKQPARKKAKVVKSRAKKVLVKVKG